MSNGVRTPQKAAACDGSYITPIRVVKKTKERAASFRVGHVKG